MNIAVLSTHRRRIQLTGPAAVCAMLLLGGCGGSATSTESAATTPAATTIPATTTVTSATGVAPVAAAPAQAAAAPARVDANPEDYAASGSRWPEWGFVTPSSTWICVITNAPSGGDSAKCAANPGQGPLPTPNVPNAQADGLGDGTQKSNGIFVGESSPSTFGIFRESIWGGNKAPAAMPYGSILHAAGFSCNAQESGVSCRDDSTGMGFTISTSSYRFEYSDVAGS